MIQKTKVYALLIGINAYEEELVLQKAVCFPALGGCVNDIKRIKDHLENDPSTTLIPTMLLDAQATKTAIQNTFKTQLSQATEADSILVYFSGHGTMEHADPALWTAEADGRLEALVCHYTKENAAKPANFLLADKELRFLIAELWEATRAHITLIFDCCHSGDNVRALQEESLRARRATNGAFVFPQRAYSDFIFSEKIKAADFQAQGIDTVVPPGKFIQMAASESNESALEVGGSGVFSTALLACLQQSGGYLSYRDLHSRIANSIRFKYAQRPKLYSPEAAEALKGAGFLGKKINAGLQTAALSYNKSQGWILNRGSIHGVEEGHTEVWVEIDNRSIEGKVKKVALDYALVQFSNMDLAHLRAKKQHQTVVKNLKIKPLRIFISNKSALSAVRDSFVETLSNEKNAAHFVLENEEEKADYAVYLWDAMSYITKPHDAFRPLVRPVTPVDEKSAERIASDLRHIATWNSYLHFENTDPAALSSQVLDIQFFAEEADGTLLLLNHNTASAELDFLPSPDGKYRRKIRCKVTNTSRSDLYIGLAFLDFDFGSMNTLFHEPVILLGPNESRWLRDQRESTIPLRLDPVALYYNWEKTSTHFQFIFSKENFDASSLALSALPQALLPEGENTKRGSFDEEEDRLVGLKQWGTKRFDLHMHNPHYNALPEAIIHEMLPEETLPNAAILAHFGIGLYAVQQTDGTWHINPAIKTEQERNIAWKLALKGVNTWANFWRNRRYTSMLEKFPNHPRIVSEGDSWFQHPLLTDIIDQVGAFYPTYCIAAAGDTIANYVKTGIFTQKIEEIKPEFFLLSGGGNDILGDAIRNFLIKNTDTSCADGTNCERFFNEKLQEATQTLLDLYETTFGILAAEYPKLNVLVHGYDYPIPVAPQAKKMSWMGKYFDEFNILRPLDRQAASHYLMDTFNTALKALAARSNGQVHYIDLRGTVGADEWYDEIHPNDVGYQKVALKFIKKITEIRQNA